MAQIRITPEDLRQGGVDITGYLETIQEATAALKSKVDEVANNWEGAAQSAFVETFTSDLYPVLSDTVPSVIEGIVAQMNAAADTIENADLEIANALSGQG